VVEGVSGVWRDLTDNVNTMASNLTTQMRDIAQVTTAVANGDLSRKITVEAKGEIQELKDCPCMISGKSEQTSFRLLNRQQVPGLTETI